MNFDKTRFLIGLALSLALATLATASIATKLPFGLAQALAVALSQAAMQILPPVTKTDTVAKIVPSIPPPGAP